MTIGGIEGAIMNLVTLRGSPNRLSAAKKVEGVLMQLASARKEGRSWAIGAYVSDGALRTLKEKGIRVEMQMNSRALARHRANLTKQVRR
jgi:hypothetical protein